MKKTKKVNALEHFRHCLGFSQKQLTKYLQDKIGTGVNINPSMISNIEKGEFLNVSKAKEANILSALRDLGFPKKDDPYSLIEIDVEETKKEKSTERKPKKEELQKPDELLTEDNIVDIIKDTKSNADRLSIVARLFKQFDISVLLSTNQFGDTRLNVSFKDVLLYSDEAKNGFFYSTDKY